MSPTSDSFCGEKETKGKHVHLLKLGARLPVHLPLLIIDGIDIYMNQAKLQDLTPVIKVFWVTLSRLTVHLYFLCVPPIVFCIPDLHVPIGRVTVLPSMWMPPAL